MIGLIPKMLFDMVFDMAGEDKVIEIKKEVEIAEDRQFGLNEFVDDKLWQNIFQTTCELLSVSQEDAEAAFADYFYKDAIKRWPMWFQISKDSMDFLKRQPSIHAQLAEGCLKEPDVMEVRKKFDVTVEQNKMTCIYSSPNHHCGLYVALARKIIDHYQDKAEVKRVKCSKEGHGNCEIQIEWNRK